MSNGCAVLIGMGLLIAVFSSIGGVWGFIGALIIIAYNLYLFSGGTGKN